MNYQQTSQDLPLTPMQLEQFPESNSFASQSDYKPNSVCLAVKLTEKDLPIQNFSFVEDYPLESQDLFKVTFEVSYSPKKTANFDSIAQLPPQSFQQLKPHSMTDKQIMKLIIPEKRLDQKRIHEVLTRRERVQRYLSKRKHRVWQKKFCYLQRKVMADSRRRIKGRFVKGCQSSEQIIPNIRKQIAESEE